MAAGTDGVRWGFKLPARVLLAASAKDETLGGGVGEGFTPWLNDPAIPFAGLLPEGGFSRPASVVYAERKYLPTTARVWWIWRLARMRCRLRGAMVDIVNECGPT